MRIFLTLTILCFSFISAAQDEDNVLGDNAVNYLESEYYELGAQMGTLIPSGISGVKENYPTVAAWFSHPTHYGNIEYSLHTAKAKGVEWLEGDLTLRLDFSIYRFFFRLF